MTSRFKAGLSPDLVRLKKKHFRRFPSLGSLEEPTRAGLLLLAKRGPELWGQWQAAYPQEIIDFSKIDFSNYRINFSGFKFRGKKISFDNSIIYNADFSGCRFETVASFNNCKFDGKSSLIDVVFEQEVTFHRTEFSETYLTRCAFLDDAEFTCCYFFGESDFRGAKFKRQADFTSSIFDARTTFNHAEFELSYFNKCTFNGGPDFREAKFLYARFIDSNFFGLPDFSCASNSKNRTIWRISFAGSRFDSQVNFENRVFDGTTDFGSIRKFERAWITKPSTFNSAPLFHGCKFHQDTNFSGAIFKDVSGQEAARAFRTLKLAMEQLKATQEEQRFFRLEMKAERHSLHWMRKPISIAYEYCSDYGFSLWRPLVALLVFSLIFGGAHGFLANACTEQPKCAASAEPGDSNERTFDLIKYVLVNVAPVPGLDKMQTDLRKPLFGEHGPIAVAAIALEILHKIVALVMTFLFALGLRNLFKMKS